MGYVSTSLRSLTSALKRIDKEWKNTEIPSHDAVREATKNFGEHVPIIAGWLEQACPSETHEFSRRAKFLLSGLADLLYVIRNRGIPYARRGEDPLQINKTPFLVTVRMVIGSLEAWARDVEGGGTPIVSGSSSAPHAQKTKQKITAEEANLRARDALKNPKLRTCRKLAKAIGCSSGLVSKLPVWRAYQEKLKTERQSGKTAHSLTKGILANLGGKDPTLEQLISEQGKDWEDSPLVSQERNRQRRRRKA